MPCFVQVIPSVLVAYAMVVICVELTASYHMRKSLALSFSTTRGPALPKSKPAGPLRTNGFWGLRVSMPEGSPAGGLLGQLPAPAGVTVIVAELVAEPPAPVHDKVNVAVTLIVAVTCVPLIERLPDHAPEAVQSVAPVELQVSVAVPAPEIA